MVENVFVFVFNSLRDKHLISHILGQNLHLNSTYSTYTADWQGHFNCLLVTWVYFDLCFKQAPHFPSLTYQFNVFFGISSRDSLKNVRYSSTNSFRHYLRNFSNETIGNFRREVSKNFHMDFSIDFCMIFFSVALAGFLSGVSANVSSRMLSGNSKIFSQKIPQILGNFSTDSFKNSFRHFSRNICQNLFQNVIRRYFLILLQLILQKWFTDFSRNSFRISRICIRNASGNISGDIFRNSSNWYPKKFLWMFFFGFF